ncbi:PEP-CTERM sorting domain-containing protein [bacterium]|nr:PEP-CTERM sorting domain-containing protein [bacterium]
MRFATSVVCKRFWFPAMFSLIFTAPLSASPIFGSLSNFDVVNDTGEVCHGFEIELEGLNPSDIFGTFGNPYIRYGDPTIIPTPTGTLIRYASGFGPSGWATGTPVPSGPFPQGGHQAFYPAYGGDPNYETLGGEHFGIAFNGNPTNTIYRWLLGDASGNLNPTGTNVSIPAPTWNVAPPVVPGAAPAVQAVIPALPIEQPGALFGEAIWVKVFVTESPDPMELNQLLPGNPRVPDSSDPAEVEVEWQLLQAGKGGMEELDSGLNELGNNSESITRRYEFYAYTGPYDPEGEALIEDPADDPTAVGEFLGAQNAALNLEAFAIPEAHSWILVSAAMVGMGLFARRRSSGS